uniref:tRNA (uracil(54)-C(5))-methyltransferase n=1 Tax=Denticeps clupeoides TaxID=299321 RepID=A0AAY4BVB7_9TELE
MSSSPKETEHPDHDQNEASRTAEDGDGKVSSGSDVYRYIKGDLFTSEIFKVEIQNLPKFIGFNDLKKFLSKHGLSPHKIKLFGKQTFAFVTFKNLEERDRAMKAVHGVLWKGRVLSVRLAKPKADPILRKRRQDAAAAVEGGEPPTKRQATDQEPEESEEPLTTQIANVVTPLWNVPYEEQLRRKAQEVEEVLQRMAREIGNCNKAMLPWLFVQKEKYNKMCYISFTLVVQDFQDYIRTTPYSVYSPETYEGHWKQLTVRTSRTHQVMAMVFFNPQKLIEEELNVLKTSMEMYFTEGAGKGSGITSLYFVRNGQRASPNTEDLSCEHVAGEKSIHEELLGLKFRISPHSFFQINTLAAEVLYSAVGDWAQLDHDTTVLDVCCGTGTIGISLAKRVKKVIGIELCQEAVEDARFNAQSNGLNNVEFHCGKAEDVFPTVLNAIVSPKLTAIVDPPRAGLHSKVILAIRRAEHLKRLIYIACNAKAAMNNFVDLCRAPSNRVRGAPFRPVRAMAVDLFPQTIHCEAILLFERVDYGSAAEKEELQPTTN